MIPNGVLDGFKEIFKTIANKIEKDLQEIANANTNIQIEHDIKQTNKLEKKIKE